MFRNMSGDEHYSCRQSAASPGLSSQESSWIGLLSAVSRPAMSFLQRYLPGRAQTPALADRPTRAGLKSRFVEEEGDFLRQLDDMMPLTHPAPHLTFLRYEHGAAAGLLEPAGGRTLPWLPADSLRELGIDSADEVDLDLCHFSQVGYLSSARTFLSHVWVSAQEIKPAGRQDCQAVSPPVKSRGDGGTWWGNLWGGEESSQRGLLSDLSWSEDGTLTDHLCPQALLVETKLPETTAVFVQGWMLGENTRPPGHKEEPDNNGGLQTVQNREGSEADHRLSTRTHLSSSEAAAACSEAALLTPDQDNGYSSLEEEQVQMFHLNMVTGAKEQQEAQLAEPGPDMEEETGEESESGQGDEEEEEQEAGAQGQDVAETTVLPPQCQNKTIAFIMGCPCSDDDDDSQSDAESSDGGDDDDDDDDGFDSEGSSDLSDSTDEDDAESSDSEVDSEAERLWTSLCRTVDPYNPRNFTARLHTRSTPPRTIPASTPPSSTQSTPASSPDSASSPALNSSPASGLDVWDDSTSASEVDEAESLSLWGSFSCSDPYSPFNFQAPLRTRGSRAKKASQPPRPAPTSPPECRKEETEERLDSGFSEPSTSSRSQSCKKVHFCEQVEEFFASSGEEEEEEDRRGPWEELARDRCRFLKRCQEVEQNISFCLQPQHRRLVYQRLTLDA